MQNINNKKLMGANSKQVKELAKNILAVVKSVTPTLSKVAKDVPFEIVITNDKKGIGIEMSIEWDHTRADDDIKVLEAKDVEEANSLEKQMLKNALAKAKGNIKNAAEYCGMSTRGFKRAMFRLNVQQ